MAQQTTQGIRLIVGLGNPGKEYAGTRHNVGFAVVERLLGKLPKSFERFHGYTSYYWSGNYAGSKLFVQMPQTYMNLSGEAVMPLAKANGITPEEILVIYDDMDLPLGKLRIRNNGGPGGHNGMKSIIAALNTEKFARMRIGIGRGATGAGMADYVLSAMTPEEQTVFDRTADGASDAVILALRRGLGMAANRYNGEDFGVSEEEKTEKQVHTKITIQHLEVQA